MCWVGESGWRVLASRAWQSLGLGLEGVCSGERNRNLADVTMSLAISMYSPAAHMSD